MKKSSDNKNKLIILLVFLGLLWWGLTVLEKHLLNNERLTGGLEGAGIEITLCEKVKDGTPINPTEHFGLGTPVYAYVKWDHLPDGEHVSGAEWLEPSGRRAHSTVVNIKPDINGEAISFYWFKTTEKAPAGRWTFRLLGNGATMKTLLFDIE